MSTSRTVVAGVSAMLVLSGRAAVQVPQAPSQAQPAVVLEADANNARETRERLTALLREHYPPSLAQVLRLDPSLLTSETYLKPYPVLAAYLAQHPEVARNPAFYLSAWVGAGREESIEERRVRAAEDQITSVLVLTGLMTFMGLIAWLVKAAFDHRRWSRASRVQTEVHTKILDRLTANEDLMAYLQSAAGRRFLEAAPAFPDGIAPASAPVNRILWSVQAGAVAVAVGLAVLFVSRRMAADLTGFAEAAPALFLMGSVVTAAGLGFVLSAAAAYALSRRLGLLPASHESTHA